jgi:hypothetical protein
MSDTIVEIEGVNYRIGRLGVFDQLHVSRRLAPLLGGLAEAVKDTPDRTPQNGDKDSQIDFAQVAKAFASMSDDDVDYIVHRCLSVCQRSVKPDGWASVQSKSGKLMYEDLTLTSLMGLSINVIQENLSDFFSTKPPTTDAK